MSHVNPYHNKFEPRLCRSCAQLRQQLVYPYSMTHEVRPHNRSRCSFVYLFAIAYSLGEGPVAFQYSAEVFPII